MHRMRIQIKNLLEVRIRYERMRIQYYLYARMLIRYAPSPSAYAITAYEIQITLFKYGSCDCGVVSTLRGLLLAIYDHKRVLTFLN